MVTRYVRPDSGETVCPSCGVVIKAPPSPRRRRVQCPKCREVVFIESSRASPPEPSAAPEQATESAVDERSRIELLEGRVAALEAALRGSVPVSPATAEKKLLWVGSGPGQTADFSPEQGRVLIHNLGSVGRQAITIRMPAGDHVAREHAEWFRTIFERVGWAVLGLEEIAAEAAGSGLSLAVSELPVAKEAAATYLALKAAGFEPISVLDSTLGDGTGGEPATMALIVAAGKVG